MKVNNCSYVKNKDCAIYFYYDKNLKGIFILDIIKLGSFYSLYRLGIELVTKVVPEHAIYFAGSNLEYIRNHSEFYKIISGIKVYRYVSR